MDQDAEEFRGDLFEADFEFGLDVVDAGQREIIGQGAMAGDVEAAANFFYLDVVHVDDFWELVDQNFKLALEAGVADQFITGFDGGRLAFDVSEDVVDLGDVVAHIGFEIGDTVVSAFQRHALVEFDMLLDVEAAGKILHADVMDVEIVASGDGADTIEDIFGALGAWERLNGDIGVGKDFMNRIGDGCHKLFGTLESYGTCEADGEIGEIAVARAADADATDFEDALDVRNGVDDLGADTGGGGVEKSVDGAAGEAPAYGDDDSCYEECGDGIGEAQPIEMIDATQNYQDEAQYDYARGPDVCRKVKGVGFERLAFVFGGDAAQSARAPHIHGHGDEHHGESPDGRFDINFAKK